MELIYTDVLYSSSEWEKGKYSKELASQLVHFDPSVSVKDSDIGHGADWPVVLVEIFNDVDWSSLFSIAGISGVFLMGEKINKNIDAWIEIGKKFRHLIEKIKPVRVDEHAAALLVINDLLKNNQQLQDIEISLQIVEFAPVSWGEDILEKRPNAHYIVTIKTHNKTIVYGMRSNMKIEFKHELSNELI